jgi:hypothetical protein
VSTHRAIEDFPLSLEFLLLGDAAGGSRLLEFFQLVPSRRSTVEFVVDLVLKHFSQFDQAGNRCERQRKQSHT